MTLDNSARNDAAREGPDRDEEALEELLSRYVDRLNAGEMLDAEKILAEHPTDGPELVERLEVFQSVCGSPCQASALGTLGDYTLRRRIGRGGMGVVYDAWQNSLDRQVALKVLPAGIAADNRAFMRFMREAKTAAQLQHQNIVAVYGMGVEQNTPYYAMEFVDGETLAQEVAKLKGAEPESPTPFGRKDGAGYFEELARAFADVADGLQHAHSKGVIHRDIKPSNLILDHERRLRILDFGLARLEGQESLTVTGDVFGTPLYMSPEQARRKKIPIDHRTDIYSLGTALYEMLALRPPFKGKDHHDTLSQIIERDPLEPRKVNPRVPRDLETIVLKCLRKEAADRYGTAEALGQDLRRFVRGDPIEARPQGRWERTTRKAWRSRWKILIASVIGILVVVSTILGHFTYRDRLAKDLARYEESVARSMLLVELSAISSAADARLEKNALLPGGLFELADFEGASGEFMEALEELSRQERRFPGRPEAYYQRARVLLALERSEDAIVDLKNALRVDAEFMPARVALEDLGEGLPPHAVSLADSSKGSESWREDWAGYHEAMRRSDYPRVVECTSRLLETSAIGQAYFGIEIESRLRRAEARLKLKDLRAFADLEVVRIRWHSAPEPVLLQGLALHLLGHPEEGEKVFQKVFEAFPRRGNTSLWVAGIYLALADPVRAARWIERVEGEPARERLRALRLQTIGDHPGAVAAGSRALELEPGNPINHVALSDLFSLRDMQRQAAILENAAKLFPQNVEIKQALADVYFWLNRFPEAIKLAREVLQVSPRLALARVTLGASLLRLGQVDEALSVLEKVARDPKNFRHTLGWANFILGRLDEARLAYEGVDRLDQDSTALRTLGLIEARRGHPDKSLPLLMKSLEGYPRDGMAHYNLALFYEERGEWELAERYLADSYRLYPEDFSHWRLLNLLRGGESENPDLSALEELFMDLERRAALPGTFRDKQLLSRIILLRNKSPDEVQRASKLAREAFEEAKFPYPEILATLADTQYALDDKASALLSLEGAMLLHHATKGMAAQLDRWRKEVSMDGVAEQRSPESMLGVARAARGDGRWGQALDSSFEGLVTYPGEARFLGELALLWTSDPSPVEARLGALAAAGVQGRRDVRARASDLLAHFRRLRETGRVRIDCGGVGYIDYGGDGNSSRAEGTWSSDAFFRGGWDHGMLQSDQMSVGVAYTETRYADGQWSPSHCFKGRITGTDDMDLYRTVRWFHPAEFRPGYQIPLPPGRYIVRLHFVETWFQAEGLRRFDVLVEGRKFLEGLDPCLKGFAVAFIEELETTVDDGLLDIEFVPLCSYPAIAAIEVLRKE
jgi:serine/threonine protein kinase/predicted Zn-dependent protease